MATIKENKFCDSGLKRLKYPDYDLIELRMLCTIRILKIKNRISLPVVLGHLSSSFFKDPSLPGDRALLTPATDPGEPFEAFCFGLYEQRFA